jgi:hypothetical protein
MVTDCSGFWGPTASTTTARTVDVRNTTMRLLDYMERMAATPGREGEAVEAKKLLEQKVKEVKEAKEVWLWYLRWSPPGCAAVGGSLQLREAAAGWPAAAPLGTPYTIVPLRETNPASALLPTTGRGGAHWLRAPRGTSAAAGRVNVLISRLDRGSWTELELFEMELNDVHVWAVDQGGFLALTDPFVMLLMTLCRTSRVLEGVMRNWFQ